MAAAEVEYRTSEPPRLRPLDRLRDILRRREVLTNLTSKELKVKYKSTVLGVAWSMLNPLLYLVVFFVVFTVFLPGGIPDYAVFLLSGLLGYTLFSTGLQAATSSVVENASLVTKVAFPREILPLAGVGASLVNFGYQFTVLIIFMAATRHSFVGANLLLVPAALAVLLLFTAALGIGTAALNVRYRDTRHLVELSLIAWFWVTPIVYSASLVMDRLGSVARTFYLANPLTAITLAFQRALYGVRLMGECAGVSTQAAVPGRAAGGDCTTVLPEAGLAWYGYRLGLVAAASVVLLALTWWGFFRSSGDFAEEL